MPRRRRRDDDRGAALVEFALVLPLLALILFGTIEFGWAFSQNLDVRHGAREAARLAAVNYRDTAGPSTLSGIGAAVCDRMDAGNQTSIQFTVPSGAAKGDYVTVRIDRQHSGLTGFLDFALPTSLSSEVEMRLEQDPDWASGSHAC